MKPPPHQTETLFRRFEIPITEAINGYPKAVVSINPDNYGLSISTVAGRLRDALNSLAKFNWPLKSPCWRISEFPEMRKNFRVSIRGNLVYLSTTPIEATPSFDSNRLELSYTSFSEPALTIVALFQLHHDRVIKTPTTITDVPDNGYPLCDPRFDISVSFENNTLTIV